MVDEAAGQPIADDPNTPTPTIGDSLPPSPSPESIHLSLGPSQSYIIHTTPHNSWSHRGSTASLAAWKALHLSTLHCVALTSHGGWVVTGIDQHDQPVVAAWENLDGSVPVAEAEDWADSRRAWRELTRALQDGDRKDLDQVRYGVGGRGAWWLRWGDGRMESGNLPKALQTSLSTQQLKGVTPTSLSLGTRDSYVAFWSDGTLTASLTGYDGVQEVLKPDSGIVHVYLSPIRDDEYMHVDHRGFVTWNFRFDEAARQDVLREMLGYMQRRAWADGTEFSMTNTSSTGSKRTIEITPETDITKSLASISPFTASSLPNLAQDLWAQPSRFLNRDILIPAAIGAGAAGAAGGAVLLGVRSYRQYRLAPQANAAVRSGSWFGRAWRTARFARRLPGPVVGLGLLGVGWQLGSWRARWLG